MTQEQANQLESIYNRLGNMSSIILDYSEANIRLLGTEYTIKDSKNATMVVIKGGSLNASSFITTLNSISNATILAPFTINTGANCWSLNTVAVVPSKTNDIVIKLSVNSGQAALLDYYIYK